MLCLPGTQLRPVDHETGAHGEWPIPFQFFGREVAIPAVPILGTPDIKKRRVVLNTPHDVSQQRADLSKEVLAWLDKYLGRVS
jgi:hypothetical protein